MRKYFWIVGFLPFVSGSVAVCQEGRTFGLKGGLVHSSHTNGTGYRSGIMIGGFLRNYHTNTIFTSLELLYTQKGPGGVPPEDDYLLSSDVYDLEPRADYLSIPMLVGIHYSSQGRSPYVFLGPRLDFLVYSEDVASLNLFDLGITAGVGFSIKLGSTVELQVEGRMSPGFLHAYPGDRDARNSSYELALGFIPSTK